MEFFQWFNSIIFFWTFFSTEMTFIQLWIVFGVCAGIYVACLVFGGIGLYAMAKKEGIKHKWLSFAPFASTAYAGKIAKDVKFFGVKIKGAGYITMAAEIACVLIAALSFVSYILLNDYYVLVDGVWQYQDVPAHLQWLVGAGMATQILSSFFGIFQLLLFYSLYLSLFNRYSPRNSIIYSLVSCFFPLRGVMIFVVRKNTPVNYEEYMQKRMEEYRRQQQTRYGGTYGGAPYGGASYTPPPAEDPFGGEFGNAPQTGGQSPEDDPFGGEFSSPKTDVNSPEEKE